MATRYFKSITVNDEVYEALDSLRWEEHIRSMNGVIAFLLKVADVEPFNESELNR